MRTPKLLVPRLPTRLANSTVLTRFITTGTALSRSVWLFPAILTVLLILLTILRVSGTSVGIYNSFFYGEQHKDPALVYGIPQPIRSDEWLVNTQMTIAQSEAGFPRINDNIGTGRDMSLIVDVPYKDWSVIFKPQNLMFFVLPLEYAFAFKWWLLLYLLLVGCYFFVLRIFPGQRLFASLAALCFGFSPFIFWWYQTITIAPLFYGFFIILLGLRILGGEPLRLFGREFSAPTTAVLYVLTLTYLLLGFGLVAYPPFQIPIAICIAFVLVGFAIQSQGSLRALLSKGFARRMSLFAAAIVIAGAIGVAFAASRANVINAVSESSYPGTRVVAAGGYSPWRLTAGFLQPQLQRDERAAHYYNNQSEASNFLLLLPFLLIPGLALIAYDFYKKRRPDWPFITLHVPILLFAANLFLPTGQVMYKLTLLDKVPHERLLIGIGFISFVHMLFVIRKLSKVTLSPRIWHLLAGSYGALCLFALLATGRYMRDHYPLFISSPALIIGWALMFGTAVILILFRRPVIALGLLLVFTVGCVIKTNPLYQGLGPLLHNQVSSSISALSKPADSWVTVDEQLLENFGLMNGRDSLSGVQFYPDTRFWRQVDSELPPDLYNRYAHIVFTSESSTPPIYLVAPDHFNVRFSCDRFNEREVDFTLATHPLTGNCLRLEKKISYPARTFFIYRVQP